MVEFSLTTTTPAAEPATREVAISGAMTIHNAAGIKEALLAAFAEADTVRMELARATEIDLTGLQLLCAAHQSSEILGKRFGFRGGGEVFTTVLEGAGFRRSTGCARDTHATCIWAKGEDL